MGAAQQAITNEKYIFLNIIFEYYFFMKLDLFQEIRKSENPIINGIQSFHAKSTNIGRDVPIDERQILTTWTPYSF